MSNNSLFPLSSSEIPQVLRFAKTQWHSVEFSEVFQVQVQLQLLGYKDQLSEAICDSATLRQSSAASLVR